MDDGSWRVTARPVRRRWTCCGRSARATRRRPGRRTSRSPTNGGRWPPGAARVTVGKGVLDPFLGRAQRAFAWTGIDREHSGVGRAHGAFPARPRPGGRHRTERPGDRGHGRGPCPGRGLARPRGAVRRRRDRPPRPGPRGRRPGERSGAPGVRHLVPWFDDSPSVELELGRDKVADAEADAEIGGTAVRVPVRLTSSRPADVKDTKLTAKTPRGRRGAAAGSPATVPAGSRVDVPWTRSPWHDGTAGGDVRGAAALRGRRDRTLTVRAFPRRRARIWRVRRRRSSGDETPDFPASAATDGDPGTRWSSPVEDDAWWQVRARRAGRGWARSCCAGRTPTPPLPRAGLAGRPHLASRRRPSGRPGRARVGPDGRAGRPVHPGPGRRPGHRVRVLALVGGGVRGGGLTARSPFPRILGRSHRPPLFTQYM